MPVSTRRHPDDPVERALEDAQPSLENDAEELQEQHQPEVTPRVDRAEASRSATLFGRMRASLGSLAQSDGLDEEHSEELAAEAPFSSIQQNELKTMLAANNRELLDAMCAMLKSNDASESAEATIPAGGRPVGGDKTGPPIAAQDVSMSGQPGAEKPVLEHDDFVPDLGRESVHARAMYEGGDTYSRPQRYVMRNDPTYDALKSKPQGTLFRVYGTIEPSLRYLANTREYLNESIEGAESGEIDLDALTLRTARVLNTISGVYDVINRYAAIVYYHIFISMT